jgi:hypothetical protein
MANTYTLIEAKTLSGATATVSFTSIPSTYTDIILKVSARTDRASTDDLLNINFNGSASNQTSKYVAGNGASASSGGYSNFYLGWVCAANNTASTFSNLAMYVPNYASATTFKSVSMDDVMETNATTSMHGLFAGLWSSNSAINQIDITSVFGTNFVQYSTFYLYGISKT